MSSGFTCENNMWERIRGLFPSFETLHYILSYQQFEPVLPPSFLWLTALPVSCFWSCICFCWCMLHMHKPLWEKRGTNLKHFFLIWKDVSDHLSLFLIAVVFELVAMLANQLVKCQEVVYSAGMDVIFECCCWWHVYFRKFLAYLTWVGYLRKL